MRVKRVRAFPFPATLKSETGSVAGQIIKLTSMGFLIETGQILLRVGSRFEITFELPVLRKFVKETAVVVKLYHQLSGGVGVSSGESGAPPPPTGAAAPATVQMAEMHFKTLSDDSRAFITEYIKMAGKGKS